MIENWGFVPQGEAQGLNEISIWLRIVLLKMSLFFIVRIDNIILFTISVDNIA